MFAKQRKALGPGEPPHLNLWFKVTGFAAAPWRALFFDYFS